MTQRVDQNPKWWRWIEDAEKLKKGRIYPSEKEERYQHLTLGYRDLFSADLHARRVGRER